MNKHTELLFTRRSIIGLIASLVTAGCSSMRMRSNAGASANPKVFPNEEAWCWHQNTAKPLDVLGKLIMRDRNPYCVLPTTTGAPNPCDATNTSTWPHALSSETTWKYLTQFDFPSATTKWKFTQNYDAVITRSMRIPYLIVHSKAKKKHVKSFGGENLLVGFEPTSGTPNNPKEWEDPDNSCSHDVSVGELAQFITQNMVRDGDTISMYVTNWNVETAGGLEAGVQNPTWVFRGAGIVVDYTFRFPVATKQALTAPQPGYIYVGYEGGGAY